MTGLLGPSGCGKTTLIRSIVGVQKVAAGDVHGARRGRRASPPLRPRRGVRDPGAVGLRRPDRAREPALLRRRAGRAARAIGRGAGGGRPRRRRRPARRHAVRRPALARVARGRAARPSPSCSCSTSRPSGSTPCCARDLWALFHRLADDGATLLVSSHVMDEAARCDRLLLMREGAPAGRHDAGRAARAHRRAGHGVGVPAPGRGAGGMSARITARHRGARAGADPPRPAHDRAAAGRPERCCCALLQRAAAATPDVRPPGRADARDVPVHHDVPRRPRSRCCASAPPARSSG